MRFALVATLAVLSPWVAEFVAFGTVDRLWLLVFLAPMYGAGAVLIREIARRGHRPWAVVGLLGTAYGIAEAGLIDMSLFNPRFDDSHDYTAAAHVPLIDASAFNALIFIVGHVVWSIGTPIALTEALAGRQWRRRPWLHRPGLVVAGVCYLGGALLIHADVADGFTPSAVQVALAFGAIAACIGAALALRRTPGAPGVAARQVSPWLVAAVAFVVTSGWCLLPESWAGAVGAAALVATTIVLLAGARQHVMWRAEHTLAAGGGALCTYLWVAVAYPVSDYPGDQANPALEHQSEAIFAAAALALLVLAARRVRDAS